MCITEPLKGRPTKCQGYGRGGENRSKLRSWRVRVSSQGLYWKVRCSSSPFGWRKFKPSALALKMIFWDTLNGVGVVKEG